MTTTDTTAIRVAWRTEAMKAASYFYYHRDCFVGFHAVPLPNEDVSEIALSGIGSNATCRGCRKAINEHLDAKQRACTEMAHIAEDEGIYD